VVITDSLSLHTSVSTREWLADLARIRQVFIQQGFAGQELAGPADIRQATAVPVGRDDCGGRRFLPPAVIDFYDVDQAPMPGRAGT
jgi:hypothetical protein